jgi:hypothetical protein
LKAGGAVSLAVNRNVSIAAGVIGSFDTSGNAMTIAGKVADSGTLTKTGAGTLEVDGAPSFASGSSLQASNGTLRWNLNSGLPSIGSGVTATVGSGATMELAGITSALGAAGGNRVSTTNNSTAPGILVTGSHQVVGGIDGSGTTQINAGSDLTADHVVQSALVIGGTSGSAGVFTIDASGPTGNPLVGGSTGSLTGNDQTFLAGAAVDENLFAADLAAPSDTGAAADSEATNSAAVPEPSTLVLACVALMGAGCSLRRSSRRMSAE